MENKTWFIRFRGTNNGFKVKAPSKRCACAIIAQYEGLSLGVEDPLLNQFITHCQVVRKPVELSSFREV